MSRLRPSGRVPGGNAPGELPATRGLAVNAGALLAARLGIAGLGWAGTLLIVRSLSVAEFGRFTFVFGVLGLLEIVTEMGVGRVAVAALLDPTRQRGSFAGSYVLLRAAMGIAGYLLAIGFVWAAGYSSELVAATAIAGLVVVVATPTAAYNLTFQASMRMPSVALRQLVGQVGQLGLTAAIAAAGGTLLWFTVPAVVAELVILALTVPAARRLVDFRYRVDLATWWLLLREAAPLSVGSALALLYYRVDTVMLSQLADFQAVGVYGVAYKFVDVVHFVPSALMLPTTTLLVRAWPQAPETFRAVARRTALLLAVAAGLVLVEFELFAAQVIRLLYGQEYAVGALAARLVVAGECVAFGSAFAFTCLVAAGRHRRYPWVALAGLVLNVALNVVVIPRYSYEGAAVATLMTEIVVLVLMVVLLLRVPGLRPLHLGGLLRVVPVALLALLTGGLTGLVLPWPAAAVLTAVIYLAGLEGLRAAGPGGLRGLLKDERPPAQVAP